MKTFRGMKKVSSQMSLNNLTPSLFFNQALDYVLNYSLYSPNLASTTSFHRKRQVGSGGNEIWYYSSSENKRDQDSGEAS